MTRIALRVRTKISLQNWLLKRPPDKARKRKAYLGYSDVFATPSGGMNRRPKCELIFARALSIVPAVAVVFGLFWILQGMIHVAVAPPTVREKLHPVDFVRLKKERPLIKKERVKPKKPKPQKEMHKPKIDIKKEVKVEKQPPMHADMDLDLSIDLSAVSALGDAYVSGFGKQEINTNVLPLSTIQPIYPKRAKMMKKEGYVKLEFTITPFGTVKDVEIVASHPARLFDNSAKNALLKWKFKPKVVADQAVEQRAMIQIDYRLNS